MRNHSWRGKSRKKRLPRGIKAPRTREDHTTYAKNGPSNPTNPRGRRT